MIPDDHFLLLSALHAAAPGVLKVIFGRDGTFQDAPQWSCLLAGQAIAPGLKIVARNYIRPTEIVDGKALLYLGSGEWATIHGAALNCAIPSIAFRLSLLCARVCLKHIGINVDEPSSVYVFDNCDQCGLEVHINSKDRFSNRFFVWDMKGQGNEHFMPTGVHALFNLPAEIVTRKEPNPANFLAALTYFLAPQIAMLEI